MNFSRNIYYPELANGPEEVICRLAEMVLSFYPNGQFKILSGPRAGLIMLQVKETVANSPFNAGEILVTEVRLELDGQFGYGICLGNSSRRAMAVALIDAALRQESPLVNELEQELELIRTVLNTEKRNLLNLVATSKVEFETF